MRLTKTTTSMRLATTISSTGTTLIGGRQTRQDRRGQRNHNVDEVDGVDEDGEVNKVDEDNICGQESDEVNIVTDMTRSPTRSPGPAKLTSEVDEADKVDEANKAGGTFEVDEIYNVNATHEVD